MRLTLHCVSVALALILLSINPAIALERDVAETRDKIADFLDRIGSISAANPPPAPNAANGHFRNSVVNDPVIKQCGKAISVKLSADGSKLWEVYKVFYQGTRGAFKANSNYYANWKNPELRRPILEQLQEGKKEIGTLVGTISASIAVPNPVTISAVTLAAKDTIESLKDQKLSTEGEHANGHISGGIDSAAVATILKIDHDTYGKATRVTQVLRAICDPMRRLQTRGHEPWLNAKWQIEYQALCKSGAIALRAIK